MGCKVCLRWVTFYLSLWDPQLTVRFPNRAFYLLEIRMLVSKHSLVILCPPPQDLVQETVFAWYIVIPGCFENAPWEISCGWWAFCSFSNSSLLYSAPELTMAKTCLLKNVIYHRELWSQPDIQLLQRTRLQTHPPGSPASAWSLQQLYLLLCCRVVGELLMGA